MGKVIAKSINWMVLINKLKLIKIIADRLSIKCWTDGSVRLFIIISLIVSFLLLKVIKLCDVFCLQLESSHLEQELGDQVNSSVKPIS